VSAVPTFSLSDSIASEESKIYTAFLIPEMDAKFSVQLEINNTQVLTYFATNLAITLIRQSVAEVLKYVIYPVFCPDTSFIDPTTARVIPISWETRLPLPTKEQIISTVAYVVREEEIGEPIIIGIDAILTLIGAIVIDGDEHMNPLFSMPGEEKELYLKPVWATGLAVSLASPV
jgi:hypothetical protein